MKRTLVELEWEVLPHPAYSPDIAPSDFHLFRSMQHALKDTHFHNFEDVRKFVENWINFKEESFYRHGIHLLPERREKVIQNKGKYFD